MSRNLHNILFMTFSPGKVSISSSAALPLVTCESAGDVSGDAMTAEPPSGMCMSPGRGARGRSGDARLGREEITRERDVVASNASCCLIAITQIIHAYLLGAIRGR